MTMQVIQHIELGSAAAVIDFQSIPNTFTDLLLVSSLREDNVSPQLSLEINGSTADRSQRSLYGASELSPTTYSYSDSTIVGGVASRSSSTSNTFSSNSVYIPNYTASIAKSFSVDAVNENNGTAANQWISAGLWNNSAAINRLTIRSDGNFVAGSSATLYGITKGSDGTTTVS